ncbi:hypothetical protein DB30_06571 [Enhygromyxa salina]|uniref:Uncharacterized protein n=1 Tax=Enhygromyxa salina TaxID=215803 RepID=A0A0C2DBX8_9BACT|nr:hypothetical protein [Enhygromyxa salina]KIG18960.1 hypothetical protein DB30_06571 [Enhygromyxa salina]
MSAGFTTQTAGDAETDSGSESADSNNATDGTPQDLPSSGDGDGDGDSGTGDGDADPTTSGDGDGDTGNAVCGNGLIDDGEQCDGGNLGGFSCVDLGYSGGTLGCDMITCTYDASACIVDMDGGGGTSG